MTLKKTLPWAACVLALAWCAAACGAPAAAPTSSAPYSFAGDTAIEVDGRSLLLEDVPGSAAEEAVILDYTYTIKAEFEKKRDILADIEPHAISIENERANFEADVYIQSFVIHQIDRLEEAEYLSETLADGARNPLYYYGLEDEVRAHALEEYTVVRVHFTQALSAAANARGPQWGDGTYERSFLVGKAAGEDAFKIYSFGMM